MKAAAILHNAAISEYISGHSILSIGCGCCVSKIFGDIFLLLTAPRLIRIAPTAFRFFFAGIRRSGYSRLYGGIHFRPAIEIGQEEGQRIWCVGVR